MSENGEIDEAARRVQQLEAELESSSDARIAADEVEKLRSVLLDWVGTVTGVVSSPGMGRVVLIHANGTQSKISSPELPYLLSPPASFDAEPGQ